MDTIVIALISGAFCLIIGFIYGVYRNESDHIDRNRVEKQKHREALEIKRIACEQILLREEALRRLSAAAKCQAGLSRPLVKKAKK